MATDPGPDPVTSLLSVLNLSEVGAVDVTVRPSETAYGSDGEPLPDLLSEDVVVFRGESQKMPHGRVFGGQVLAQGVIACGRTVAPVDGGPARPIHSLHAYFMRPGDDQAPIHFAVERMRDGRSFSTRRMHAIQHGQPILAMSASFQEPAGGLDHQDAMPDVAPPEDVESLIDLFQDSENPGARHIADQRPVDQRHVDGHLYGVPHDLRLADQSVWLRTRGALPDDPLVHSAVLAYSSDYALLEPVLRRHGMVWRDPRLRVASLDHAMWFHRPARVDDWVLYTQHSPSAQGGRGLGMGQMFTRDGRLAATVVQEGMVRVKD